MGIESGSIRVPDRIELVSPDALVAYERNSRTHSAEQIEQISNSIKEFGFTNPILVDGNGGVIAGHGRILAAKKLGLDNIPVIRLPYLTSAQRRALVLADNRIALNAGWDAAILQAELADLDELDFDLSSVGFSDEEMKAILKAEDPEDVIAPGPAPILRKQFEDASEAGQSEHEELAPGEDPYTKKIEAPIYEPKGERPSVFELVDLEKTTKLAAEIKAADLPGEIKQFLLYAAQRHSVFNYEKIAEYYAHAPAEVQNLMERSALVIIDFDKAIENGFVSMTREIAEAYPSEASE